MTLQRAHSINHHGQEAQPVIVIDGFVPRPEVLIGDAAMLAFRPIGLHYPGVRAKVSPAIVARFMDGLDALIADVFGLRKPFSEVECCYSLVTRPPAELAPIQRLPHFDSVDPGRIAILHYLAPGEEGGTGFFRQKSTGFETVSDDRLGRYTTALEADLALHGRPPAAYISGETPLFEQIAYYEARFNRAIIYRGHTLHCADIPPGMALPSDPLTGRLTVNTFVQGAVA
jgi:Family of unknown function (DUF6445)